MDCWVSPAALVGEERLIAVALNSTVTPTALLEVASAFEAPTMGVAVTSARSRLWGSTAFVESIFPANMVKYLWITLRERKDTENLKVFFETYCLKGIRSL